MKFLITSGDETKRARTPTDARAAARALTFSTLEDATIHEISADGDRWQAIEEVSGDDARTQHVAHLRAMAFSSLFSL